MKGSPPDPLPTPATTVGIGEHGFQEDFEIMPLTYYLAYALYAHAHAAAARDCAQQPASNLIK